MVGGSGDFAGGEAFFSAEVTSGIGAPEVAIVGKIGAGAESAAADIEPFAISAGSGHTSLAFFERKQADRANGGLVP